jgi:NAD(P)H-dependent FMN reductase
MSQPKLIAIAGSLRKGSYNAALLRAAVELCPPELSIEVGTIRGIPLYDGDLEGERGLPEAVVTLKEQIASSAGLLIVTPEYNNSMPGVLKNAIDWLSRPAADLPRVFGGRPVAVMGASPGRLGTVLSQAAWLPVLRSLGTCPWWGARLQVGGAASVWDAEGKLVDERVRGEVKAFMQGFAGFVIDSTG